MHSLKFWSGRFSIVVFVHLVAVLAAPTSFGQAGQCIETNGVKFVMPPQVDGGWDVRDSRGIVIADDFFCNTTGPVTDIHIWGSWLGDAHGQITNFWIGIYDDVPATTNVLNNQITPSHPGTNLLWQQWFGLGQFIESFYATGSEGFFDPSVHNLIGGDTMCWYYCFYPTNPFVQQGTPNKPTNYWLSVYAEVPDAATLFGWKTTQGQYNDRAVWGNFQQALRLPAGDWLAMTNIEFPKPINLAFKLTTPTNTPPPPPQGCVETNGAKYVQWPNENGGLDVWNNPYVLADDFKCINSGAITDIHLWGSWLNDQVQSNSISFWLGIYDDVPVGPGNTFSHPGKLLWDQWFAPGQYSENFWSFGQETFLDPGQPGIIGLDSQIWYYCFYPTNPFVQAGSAANPKIYWLAAYAQLPVGTQFKSGWKTTTNLQFDISVHVPWPGVPPTNNPVWTPTILPSGAPLDLAFKLTTPTNKCFVPIACAADKTVECGSAWSFDPPFVGPDPCCPTAPLVTMSIVTNRNAPCNQSYTATWTISDCAGVVLGVCAQTVTVLDSTPPVITCASNKTVECGSAWSFDPPTTTDACCGTNVVISAISTVTNGLGCSFTVTRTWLAEDCCTNRINCSQTVTVRDVTPPIIVCPTNIVVFICETNAVVTWSIIATDACSTVTITSSPPSGSIFLPNTTNLVTATASDLCSNTATCTFTVTVRRPVLGPIFINHIATNKVVLTWTNGILQVATNVIGPYLDVTGATSPYTNTTFPWPPTNRFYRLKCNSP